MRFAGLRLWGRLILGGALALLLGSVTVKGVDSPGTVPKFDPATVSTFEATVVEVREAEKSTSLQVRGESETSLDVYLGPTAFVKSFEIAFRKGDRVHVTGSRVKSGGDVVIVAREVRKESTTLYLRAKDGTPYW